MNASAHETAKPQTAGASHDQRCKAPTVQAPCSESNAVVDFDATPKAAFPAQSVAVGPDGPSTAEAAWLGLLARSATDAAVNDSGADQDQAENDGHDLARQEKAILRTYVGVRMSAARELAGLTQTQAARQLGYQKSGQLSLIEAGRKSPPLTVLIRAARAYGVAVDFLLGLQDEVERDPRLARRAAMRQFLDARLAALADAVTRAFEDTLALDHSDAKPLADSAARVVETFARVSRRAEFNDVPGGATLQREMRELEQALDPVLQHLRRQTALDAQLREKLAAARQHVSDLR